MNRRSLRYVVAATLLLSLLGVTAVYAGVGLTPTLVDLILPPGSSYEGMIRITNTGEESIVVESSATGFIAPQGVAILLEPGAENSYQYSGADLLTIEPAEHTIEAGETFDFSYRISMPEELDPYGGRYAAAVFRVVPPASESQVSVSTQVATLFLVTPGSDVASDYEAEVMSIMQEEDSRSVKIMVAMHNHGNVHVVADQLYGVVHVVDADGYVIDQFEAFAHTMLPGEENAHVHHATWVAPDSLPSGEYSFHILVIDFSRTDGEMHFESVHMVNLQF